MAKWRDDNLLKESRMREWFSPTGHIPLKQNPSSGRYDFDGNLTSQMLSNFVAEGGDGFTIDFGVVSGDFNCSGLGLTSLKGAPLLIGGDFDCSNNNLTSIKDAPKKIGGNLYINNNPLISSRGKSIVDLLKSIKSVVGGKIFSSK